MSTSLTIIGSGIAAYTLAREYRKLDSASSVEIITRDAGCFYSKPSLSNALANGKTPAQIPIKTVGQMADDLKADIHSNAEVITIDPEKRQLTLKDGRQIAFKRLAIAWGADPVHLPMQTEAANEVLSVNDLDDYTRFHAKALQAKSIAIIGAGLVGCEFANDLALQQKKIIMIDPGNWPLSRLLPEAAGRYLMDAFTQKQIEFQLANSVQSVMHTSSGYCVALSNARTFDVDLVLSSVGLRPRTQLAKAAGIDCNRGILADSCLQTNIESIYAIGDCAEIAGRYLPFIMPIMHQARALARTLIGESKPLVYPLMPIAVKTPFCPIIVCPPDTGIEGNWQCEPVENGFEAGFIDTKGQLRGFALLGKATLKSQEMTARILI